jgi:formate-dependent nitrite reductase membrane component NrfD
VPNTTEKSDDSLWGEQVNGVGHYAKYAESLACKSYDEMADTLAGSPNTMTTYGGEKSAPKSSMQVAMEQANPKRVYDTPDKGILWGWEVSGYVFTKAISAGAVLTLCLAKISGLTYSTETSWLGIALGLIFLTLTGALLVKDLDQPARFVYVILRPQWNSWLVKGGYAITVFGGLLTVWAAGLFFNLPILETIGFWGSAVTAILVAVYTAFLFAQAKGRDFWQSPTLPLHMLVHSFMAGSAALLIGAIFMEAGVVWIDFLINVLVISIIANLVILVFELTITHPTQDAKTVVHMIVAGRYKTKFWAGVIVLGNLTPLVMLTLGAPAAVAALIALLGIIITETIWVEAPQRIPLA